MIKTTITQEKNIFIALFLYAFLLIFFCSRMSPLYPINDWSDINLYFNIGKMIGEGKVLYTEAFDHKGPLIFFIYSIGTTISSSSFFGMYLIESVCWAIMIFFAYLTARIYLDKFYAFIVAMIFPVIMLSHTLDGGSAEEFIAIPQVISLYLFIRYFKNKDASIHKPVYMLVHGMMFTFVLLTKINLVVFWFFPLLFIFINLIIKKEYKNLIQNALGGLIGILIILLPTCIYFFANNALSEAWNIYIVLNKSYATIGSLTEIIKNLIVHFYLWVRLETFECLIILVGVIYFPIKYIDNKLGRIALILSFCSIYITIFSSLVYVYYYSIPYYIYALPGCIVLIRFITIKSTRLAYAISFVLILALGIKQRDFFRVQIGELIKPDRSKVFAYRFSDIISKEKKTTLLNLGLDRGNSVFTAANIVPTVKYFTTPNVAHSLYPDMRNEQTKYIENKEVQFIILGSSSMNYNYFSKLPSLNENYAVVDSIYWEQDKMIYYLYKKND